MNRNISVKKVMDIAKERCDEQLVLRLPYKVKFKNRKGKEKQTRILSIKILLNAIELTNLKHPVTEEIPKPIDMKTIKSCYIFGSSVKPRYEKVVKKYLFGLYVYKKEQIVIPNNIDILCFVNNNYDMRHIKSMTSWKTIIFSDYSHYYQTKYTNFDISFVPSSIICKDDIDNNNFLEEIRSSGVCIMGDNILRVKRCADWSHDTIKDIVRCDIPRRDNITEEEMEEEENREITNRYEILDI